MAMEQTEDEIRFFWVCGSAKVFGCFVGLVLLSYLYRQRKRALSDCDESAAKALFLPVYLPILWVLIAGLLTETFMMITKQYIASSTFSYHTSDNPGDDTLPLVFDMITNGIYEVLRDGFTVLFLFPFVSKATFKYAAFASLLWVLHGFTSTILEYYFDTYGKYYFHGVPFVYYIFLAYGGIFQWKFYRRWSIWHYSVYMAIYRFVWLFYSFMMSDAVSSLQDHLYWPTLAAIGLLELPLTSLNYFTLLLDTRYWRNGGNLVHSAIRAAKAAELKNSQKRSASPRDFPSRPPPSLSPSQIAAHMHSALNSSTQYDSLTGPGGEFRSDRANNNSRDDFNSSDDPLSAMRVSLLADSSDAVLSHSLQQLIETAVNSSTFIDFAFISIRPRLLGTGSNSRVFEGMYKKKLCAIKFFVRNSDSVSEKTIQLYAKETAIAARLRHPNIVRMYGICCAPPTIFLVMEICIGSLFDVLHCRNNTQLSKNAKSECIDCEVDEDGHTPGGRMNGSHSSGSVPVSVPFIAGSAVTASPNSGSSSANLSVSVPDSSFYPHSQHQSVGGHHSRGQSNTLLSPSPSHLNNGTGSGGTVHLSPSASTLTEESLDLIFHDWPYLKILKTCLDCGKAVEYIHSIGILHRDIKSLNFLVGEDGKIKLNDFGLSRLFPGLEEHTHPAALTTADSSSSSSSAAHRKQQHDSEISIRSTRGSSADGHQGHVVTIGARHSSFEDTKTSASSSRDSPSPPSRSATPGSAVSAAAPSPRSAAFAAHLSPAQLLRHLSAGDVTEEVEKNGLHAMDVATQGAEDILLTRRVGTRLWMSPEMLRRKPYSFSSDIYSLALVFFEIVSGSIPFDDLSESEFENAVVDDEERPDLPSETPMELRQLIEKMWLAEARNRPTASMIVKQLEKMYEEEGKRMKEKELRKQTGGLGSGRRSQRGSGNKLNEEESKRIPTPISGKMQRAVA